MKFAEAALLGTRGVIIGIPLLKLYKLLKMLMLQLSVGEAWRRFLN